MMPREPLTRVRLHSPPHSPLSFAKPSSPKKASLSPVSPLVPPRELNIPTPLPRIPPPSPPCMLNTLVEEHESEDEEDRVVQILTEMTPSSPVNIECEEKPQEEKNIVLRPRPASVVLCRSKLIDHELAHGKAIPELDSSIWANTVKTPTDAGKKQSDELSCAMKIIEDLQREREELLEQLRFLGH